MPNDDLIVHLLADLSTIREELTTALLFPAPPKPQVEIVLKKVDSVITKLIRLQQLGE